MESSVLGQTRPTPTAVPLCAAADSVSPCRVPSNGRCRRSFSVRNCARGRGVRAHASARVRMPWRPRTLIARAREHQGDRLWRHEVRSGDLPVRVTQTAQHRDLTNALRHGVQGAWPGGETFRASELCSFMMEQRYVARRLAMSRAARALVSMVFQSRALIASRGAIQEPPMAAMSGSLR